MADLLNLEAESNRNIIGDDATPTLTLENNSTGQVLALKRGVAGIPAANATIGQELQFSAPSRASGAYIKFNSGLVSLTSILATTGGAAGTYGVRVVVPDGTFGWIPVYPDDAVTAAAI